MFLCEPVQLGLMDFSKLGVIGFMFFAWLLYCILNIFSKKRTIISCLVSIGQGLFSLGRHSVAWNVVIFFLFQHNPQL